VRLIWGTDVLPTLLLLLAANKRESFNLPWLPGLQAAMADATEACTTSHLEQRLVLFVLSLFAASAQGFTQMQTMSIYKTNCEVAKVIHVCFLIQQQTRKYDYGHELTLTPTLMLVLFQQPQSSCLIQQLTQTMTPQL
jgi:hypothetical protein